jgi:hypothetical protein
MKKTAVEFLIEQISSSKYFYNLMEELESRGTIVQPNGILQQAKEMEKEQIIDAFGVGCQVESTRLIGYQGMAEQYYNETFKK